MERMGSKQPKLEYDEKGSDELIEQGDSEEELEFEYTQSQQNTMERSQFHTQHTFSTQTEAYNPEQDRREVLEIRRSYAHLREEMSNNSRELTKANSNRLSELIDEANAVFSRVHTTSDASLDSKFMTETADLGVAKVQKLPLFVSEFSFESYLRIMNQYLLASSWENVGNLLSNYWVGVETSDYMLGSMELEIKKRIAPINPIIKGSTLKEAAPVVIPSTVNLRSNENVSSGELSRETSENVMKVYSILEGIGSFPFYQFITDPNSFARTVENMFYVSFLVRDNRARVFIPEIAAERNELYIEAVSPESEEEEVGEEDGEEQDDRNTNSNEFNQLVLGMTTKIWQNTIQKYKIEKSFFDLFS